jgi:hypothetical protein
MLRSKSIFLAAAAVGLAIVLSACGGGQRASVSEHITAADGGTVSIGDDIIVRIPPDALSEDATVAITRASEDNYAPGELEGAQSVGGAFNIDLGGAKLSQPVRLEIAYDPGLLPEDSPQDAVFLAFYDEESAQWLPVYGTVDVGRHVVVVETDHLSWWNPFSWDLSELKAQIMRGLESLLELGGLPVAEIPQCGAAPAHMSLDFTDSLLACIEGAGTGGQAVLRLANNRAYAIVLRLSPGVQLHDVSLGSLTEAAGELLEEKLGKDVVYIPAAGDAELSLQFEEAGEISLLSAPSDMTLALDMFLAIVSALRADPDNVIDGMKCLFEIMTAGDGGIPAFGDLLDVAKRCAGVALKNTTAGVVLKAIRSFITIGVAAGERIVQQFVSNAQGEVTVTYSPPQPTPTPTPLTKFTDPFAYCAAVGTVDRQMRWDDPAASELGLGLLDDRWAGPAMPDEIKERLDGAPPFGSFVWRCFEGKVMACTVAAHNWCGTADTSVEPSDFTVGTCEETGRFWGQDPFLKANVYAWDCQGGLVVRVGRKVLLGMAGEVIELSVDPRGFFSEWWEELEP